MAFLTDAAQVMYPNLPMSAWTFDSDMAVRSLPPLDAPHDGHSLLSHGTPVKFSSLEFVCLELVRIRTAACRLNRDSG